MNFDFKDNEVALREKLKELFDPDSRSALRQLEGGDTRKIRDLVLQWLVKLGQAGYLALGLENGKSSMRILAAQETLATISPSLFLSVEVSARIFGRLVASFGTTEQKNEILPALKGPRDMW
jgi:alkylation response protein AidB-like acyl-CoA dehydrogenase